MDVTILLLTLQCVHASEMIGTCRNVIDNTRNPDDRELASQVWLDARDALHTARSALVYRGANVREATAAILGLAWPVPKC